MDGRKPILASFYLVLEEIAGEAHVHGPGPTALREIERDGDVFAEPLRLAGHPRGLGDGGGRRGLVHLLKGAAPRLAQRRRPAQEDHRRFRHERAIERGQRVQVPGPRRHEGHARLLGQPAPGVGHVHGGRLVARVDDADPGADSGVVEGQDLIARQGEELTHTGSNQRLDDQIRATLGHASPLSVRGRGRPRARRLPPPRRARRRARPPCC